MPTHKITTTNAALVALSQGIALVDNGYETTVDGKNVRRCFKLNAEVRYALARTGIVIKPLLEAWKEANTKLFESHEPEIITDKDGNDQRAIPASRAAEFESGARELLATSLDIELPVIPVTALKVGDAKDENPIPATALTFLDPILTWPASEG